MRLSIFSVFGVGLSIFGVLGMRSLVLGVLGLGASSSELANILLLISGSRADSFILGSFGLLGVLGVGTSVSGLAVLAAALVIT